MFLMLSFIRLFDANTLKRKSRAFQKTFFLKSNQLKYRRVGTFIYFLTFSLALDELRIINPQKKKKKKKKKKTKKKK